MIIIVIIKVGKQSVQRSKTGGEGAGNEEKEILKIKKNEFVFSFLFFVCVGDDIIVKRRRRNQTNTRGHVVKVWLEVFEMKIQFHFFSTILKNEMNIL
jgi:hypothetical protein